MTVMTPARCALCQKEAELKMSHVIPKFVYDWIKRTSATGYLRHSSNVDKRAQDGHKLPLLCGECEQRFSVAEKKFAEKIFSAHMDRREQSASYQSWLYYFLMSLAFRVLFINQDVRDREPDYRDDVDQALVDWRMYLLNDDTALPSYEAHLLPIDPEIKISSLPSFMPPKTAFYLTRGTDLDVVTSDKYMMVYVQIPGFIIFFTIKPKHQPFIESTFIGEQGLISLGKPEDRQVPEGFLEHIGRRVRDAFPEMNSRSQETVAKSIAQHPERAAHSLSVKVGEVVERLEGRPIAEEEHES